MSEEWWYARAAAYAAIAEAKADLGRRGIRLGRRPVPGLFTCPECHRVNLKAKRVDRETWKIVSHIAGAPDSGLGRCEGSHGPGEVQT